MNVHLRALIAVMAGHAKHELLEIERIVFSLLVETFLFALYVVLVAYLVFRRRAAHKTFVLPFPLLVFTLIMFAIFVLYWVLDIYLLGVKYRSVLKSPQLSSRTVKHMHLKGAPSTEGLPPEAFPVLFVQWASELTLIVLGDFVSLWRSWVVFGKPRWLYVIIVCTALAESVIFILLFVTTSPAFFPTSSALTHVSAKARIPLTFFGYSSAGLAQLGSTSLISYKAWAYWKDLRGLSVTQSKASRFKISSTLAIVVETGIAYVALLAWYGFIDFFGANTSTAVRTARFYSIPLIAMYPTLVVVIVALRCSVLESHITSKVSSPAHTDVPRLVTSLAFADRRRSSCSDLSTSDDSGTREYERRWLEVSFGDSLRVLSVVPMAKDGSDTGDTSDKSSICSTASMQA